MRFISFLGPISTSIVLVLITIFIYGETRAQSIRSNSPGCADVLMVFLRGSGQNKNHEAIDDPFDEEFAELEKESFAFFDWHKSYLDANYPNLSYKAVSVHNFEAKYSPVGYRAVPVGFGSDNRLLNTANAESSWVPGDYRESVEHGIIETVGYLKDQVKSCPDQYLMLGGYSQGAQVLGDSLFQLSEDERSKILGIGLFGDPKYIGAKDGNSYPWRRGDAANNDTGMLEARIPYVPEDLSSKTLSWCSKHDIICGGWSALRQGSSHGQYSYNPMMHTVKELLAKAAAQLKMLDRFRAEGGDGNAPIVQISLDDQKRSRDVMFLVNDNSNNDVSRVFRFYLDPMLPQFIESFGPSRFGYKGFGENDYGGFQAPRVTNVQSLLPLTGYDPLKPDTTSSNLAKAYYKQYGNLLSIVGGGDIDDPYQLVLERAILDPSWSPNREVERNIVMIVDRPPKEEYEYNICNGTVRLWLLYPDVDGYKNCYENYIPESWSRHVAPEACENIQLVITQQICENPLKAPSYRQFNRRTLTDSFRLAQAFGVKVSIVIPRMQVNTSNALHKQDVRDRLRYLAESTGGIFIYYDEEDGYNSSLLHDSLFRVYTKPQRSLTPLVDGLPAGQPTPVTAGKPTIIDVSQGGIFASSYHWDITNDGTVDVITNGPLLEHEFDDEGPGLMRVAALDESHQVIAETIIGYTVEDAEPDNSEIPPPVLPSGISAQQNTENTVVISWSPIRDDGELVIIDPHSQLPITSVPLSAGSATLYGEYEEIIVRVVTDNGASASHRIAVTPFVPPATIAGCPGLMCKDQQLLNVVEARGVESVSSPSVSSTAVSSNDMPQAVGVSVSGYENNPTTGNDQETLGIVVSKQVQAENHDNKQRFIISAILFAALVIITYLLRKRLMPRSTA